MQRTCSLRLDRRTLLARLLLVSQCATFAAACSGSSDASESGGSADSVEPSFRVLGSFEMEALEVSVGRFDEEGVLRVVLRDHEGPVHKLVTVRDGVPEAVEVLEGIPDIARVEAMSADGARLGGTALGGQLERFAFLWIGGRAGLLENPGRPDPHPSRITAVSADGSVAVGYYEPSLLERQALRWDVPLGSGDVRFHELGRLDDEHPKSYAIGVSDDGDRVYGISQVDEHHRMFVTERGPAEIDESLPAWTGELEVHDVSDDGSTVVGKGYDVDSELWVAFRTDGVETAIASVGTQGSEATAVSGDGRRAVGEIWREGAFVWDRGSEPVLLADVLAEHGLTDLGGMRSLTVHGISADGTWLFGDGVVRGIERELWIARVPAAAPAH